MVKQYITDYTSMQQSLGDSVSWLKSYVHNGRMNLVAFYLPSVEKGENLSDNSLCIYIIYLLVYQANFERYICRSQCRALPLYSHKVHVNWRDLTHFVYKNQCTWTLAKWYFHTFVFILLILNSFLAIFEPYKSKSVMKSLEIETNLDVVVWNRWKINTSRFLNFGGISWNVKVGTPYTGNYDQ